MDYFLTEEQEAIQEIARQIAEEKIVPVREELDETQEFPTEIMKICGGSGDLHRCRRTFQGVSRGLCQLRSHRSGRLPDPAQWK